MKKKCPDCGGSGWKLVQKTAGDFCHDHANMLGERSTDVVFTHVVCPTCKGTGETEEPKGAEQ